MPLLEIQKWENNYVTTAPDMNRGGGGVEDASLNTQSLIDRIKQTMEDDEEKREREQGK